MKPLNSLSVYFMSRFQAVGGKKDTVDFEQFHKFYNELMFENQKTVSVTLKLNVIRFKPCTFNCCSKACVLYCMCLLDIR